MPNRHEGATALQVGRIGLIGALIGALIGGVASFSAAYLTYRQQRDTHAADLKRETYVTLMAKTHDFTSTLNRLGDAAARKDQTTYAEAREELRARAYPDLYTAIAAVYIVGDKCVMRKAIAIGTTLVGYGKYIPPSLNEFNEEPIRRIFEEGRKASNLFQQEAREDVLGKPSPCGT